MPQPDLLPHEEPIYWSGEPERTHLVREAPSDVIVVRPQRIMARAAWLVMTAALVSIVLMNYLPPYHQSNIRMIVRAMRDTGYHAMRHPIIVPPLLAAGAFDMLGLYNLEVSEYDFVLRIDPTLAWAYYGRGSANRARGSTSSTITDLTTALTLDPELVWAYNMRGLVFRDSLQDYDAARADFEQSIALDPGFAWAHVNLARLHPDPLVALDHFEQAIALGLSNRPEVYVHRGNTYVRLNRYDDALNDFDHAQSLDPNFPWIYFYRPRAYEAVGNITDAIADYDRFLELNPTDDPNAQWARAERARLLGENITAVPQPIIEATATYFGWGDFAPVLTPLVTPGPTARSGFHHAP
jgi:Tfp pilus assembly protein PilF